MARISIRRMPSAVATCATTWDLPTPGGPQRKAGLWICASNCSEDAISDGFMDGDLHDGPPWSLSPGT